MSIFKFANMLGVGLVKTVIILN